MAAVPNFDQFYKESRLEMYRALVLVLQDRELATDALGEAFARAFERWDVVGGYDNPRGWVYRVGVNWARSRLRKTRREFPGTFADPSYEVKLSEPEVLAAVTSLPLKYRSVIVCRFFLDWTIDQTSEALHIPSGTVKTRQHRAISLLRSSLKDKS